MDLMRPMQDEILGEKIYVCVYDNDYYRFECIHENSNTFTIFESLYHYLQCEKEEELGKIIPIQRDHDKEFESYNFYLLCSTKGITYEIYIPISPQQIGIVEKKNHTLRVMEKVILYAI